MNTIKTVEDYDAALARMEKLLNTDNDRKIEALAILIEEYENRYWPMDIEPNALERAAITLLYVVLMIICGGIFVWLVFNVPMG